MKSILTKLFFLALFLPAKSFAQDINGIWRGQLYVDSTKTYLPYEVLISNANGKLMGYSHITFEEKGRKEVGVRSILIKRQGDKILLEDQNFIDYNFADDPPINIKKTMVVTIEKVDNLMNLNGNWTTNKTKVYTAATGTVKLQYVKEYKTTTLYKKLKNLQLTDKLFL